MISKRLCFYTKRLNPNRPDYCRGRGNTKQPISDRLDINYNYRLFLRSLVILSYCRRTWPFSVTVHSRDIFIWLLRQARPLYRPMQFCCIYEYLDDLVPLSTVFLWKMKRIGSQQSISSFFKRRNTRG